jgi:hypothetical protein
MPMTLPLAMMRSNLRLQISSPRWTTRNVDSGRERGSREISDAPFLHTLTGFVERPVQRPQFRIPILGEQKKVRVVCSHFRGGAVKSPSAPRHALDGFPPQDRKLQDFAEDVIHVGGAASRENLFSANVGELGQENRGRHGIDFIPPDRMQNRLGFHRVCLGEESGRENPRIRDDAALHPSAVFP